MSKKPMFFLGFVFLAVSLACLGWKLTSRTAYESAEYTVLESDGALQTREYPVLHLATTDMRFEAQGEDGSFMRLFRYISGANHDERKVAMTTPVFMEPNTDAEGQMGFVIPKNIVEQGIPEPLDDAVEIETRSRGQYAVIRFRGRVNEESFTAAEQKLRSWMSTRGLIGDDAVEFAGYDPPWTPGPLRRNEVLIRLREAT